MGGADRESAQMLAEAGIRAGEFADPDTRVPHRVSVRLLEHTLSKTGNPALGLHAAEAMESADVDLLAYAARSCSNIGEAFFCKIRYFRLMNDAAELTLVSEGDRVILTYRVTSGIEEPPAAADFVLAGLWRFLQGNARIDGADGSGCEVWVTQPRPSYEAEYRRIFGCPVRFAAPSNSIVMPVSWLSIPMLRPDPRIARAFQRRADRMLERLVETEGVTGQVRRLVVQHIGSGAVSMDWIARRMAMSTSTLRRHLEAEGTTFRDIVDEVRRQLAERYLREGSDAISELAFLLGFSNAAAFHRAFKRWTGLAPTDYRVRHRA